MSTSTRLLVMGDGWGARAVLRGLLAGGFAPDVATQDDDVRRLASGAGGAVFERYDDWPHRADGLAICAGYKPIIPESMIRPRRILNVHYSLLPKYRGLHSTVWAMLNGEEFAGYTVHEMDPWVDHGAIVRQERVEIGRKTSTEIMEELHVLVTASIAGAVRGYLDGSIVPRPQDHSQATFVGKRNLEDCRIDFRRSAAWTERLLRALVPPYPAPFFDYREKRYEIVRATVIEKRYEEIDGHVVYRDPDGVYVKLPDGVVRLERLRTDGQELAALDVFKSVGYRF